MNPKKETANDGKTVEAAADQMLVCWSTEF